MSVFSAGRSSAVTDGTASEDPLGHVGVRRVDSNSSRNVLQSTDLTERQCRLLYLIYLYTSKDIGHDNRRKETLLSRRDLDLLINELCAMERLDYVYDYSHFDADKSEQVCYRTSISDDRIIHRQLDINFLVKKKLIAFTDLLGYCYVTDKGERKARRLSEGTKQTLRDKLLVQTSGKDCERAGNLYYPVWDDSSPTLYKLQSADGLFEKSSNLR